MANTVGMKLQLDGEKEYRQQLTNIITSTKTLDKQMAALESSFDDTTDAAKKHNSMIALLEKKQEALKNESDLLLKKMEQLIEDGYEETDTAVLKLAGQMADVEKKYNETTGAINDHTRALDEASESADDLGDSMSDAGSVGSDAMYEMVNSIKNSSLVTAITSVVDAASGIISSAISASEEWRKACDDIVFMTGATAEEVEIYAEQMKDAYAGIQSNEITEEDVAKALATAATLFGYQDEQLTELTTRVGNFAAATGTSATTAMESLYQITQKWGIEAGNEKELLDKLYTATADGGVAIDTLTNMLTQNHAALEGMGMDLDSAINFVMRYTQAGGDASETTRALTTAARNLSDMGLDPMQMETYFNTAIEKAGEAKTAVEAMDQVIGVLADGTAVKISDVFGEGAAGQKIVDTFTNGKYAAEDFSQAITDAADGNKGLGRLQEAMDASWDKMDELTKKANTVKAEIGKGFTELGNQIIVGLSEFFGKTNASTTTWLNDLKGKMDGYQFELKVGIPDIAYDFDSGNNTAIARKIRTHWMASGYQNAMLLNSPTIFGMTRNGTLLGGGDRAGAEVVVGETHLLGMMTRAVQNAFGYAGGGVTNTYGGQTINIYGAPGQDVKELARLVGNEINRSVKSRRAV